MATKNPADVTGRKRDELAAQNVEEVQKRAEEMSLATAEKAERLETEVIDATTPGRPTIIVDKVTTVGKTDPDNVEVRVIADVQSMTFGAGNTYDFRAGQKYLVTKNLATHLLEKGYILGF
jgi:hypothetical protein